MCKFYHSLLILRKNFENSDRSMYAICVINFVHNLRCLLKNLRSQLKFYVTGRDKYHLWNHINNLLSIVGFARWNERTIVHQNIYRKQSQTEPFKRTKSACKTIGLFIAGGCKNNLWFAWKTWPNTTRENITDISLISSTFCISAIKLKHSLLYNWNMCEIWNGQLDIGSQLYGRCFCVPKSPYMYLCKHSLQKISARVFNTLSIGMFYLESS